MVRIEVFAAKDRFIFDYEGTAPLTVGRLPSCELPIPMNDVSREHCRIVPDGTGGFRVFDLGSKNGVHVNGARVKEDAALERGDEVRVAPEARFVFGERVAAKVETPKPAAKPDALKAEAAKPAAVKTEGAKADGVKAETPRPEGAKADAAASEAPAADAAAESPAERARRTAQERARQAARHRRMVLLGICLFLGITGYGVYAYVLAPDPATSAGATEGGAASEVASVPAGHVTESEAAQRAIEAERDWARLEALELEPELLASTLDAYARRYPASPRAKEAAQRASSLRRVAEAGSAGAGAHASTASTGARTEAAAGASRPGEPAAAASSAKAAQLEAEVEALVKEGALLEARFLAGAASRLFGLPRASEERLLRRVQGAAYDRFTSERERARELVKEGRPLDGYARIEAGLGAWRRFDFAKEAQDEAASLRAAVARALDAGGAASSVPSGGSGDRTLLEKLVPEAKRATVACDFEAALDRWRQVLELPLTEEERLQFQWRVFDLRRARELFRELLLTVAETAAGGKNAPPPIRLTITQAIQGVVIEADVIGVKVALEIPGETTKVQQLYERKWKDLAPFQMLEIFRGMRLEGDGLLALAAFCFEAEYEIDAHAALADCWERYPAWRAEAAALLRRRTGSRAAPSELVVFEGRLVSKAERQRIEDERSAAKAEAERIKQELAAAKKDASGKHFLERANALIEAGMFVEGRQGLAEIARKWKDVEAGKEAKARWEDPFLRRRVQRRAGRDDNRVSITFMAEGYAVAKNEEQRAFDALADRTKSILEKADLWKEYDGWFNYYSMNLWSKESGVDREPGGIKRDTPLGGEVNAGTFTIQNGLVRQYLSRFPGRAVGVALGNDNASVATGGGGACAVAKGMIEVTAHEIGHAFASLGDEYDIDPTSGKPSGAGGRSKTPLPTSILGPNLIGGNQKDDMRQKAPWAHWITLGTANWTGKVVDLFEGGNQTPFDVWRPQSDCRMRTSSSPFCCVCMEQMVLHLYGAVRPIDEIEPKEAQQEVTSGESIVLKATCLRPKSRPLDALWEIAEAAESESPDGSTVVREKKGKRLDNVSQVDLPDGRTLYGAKVTATPGLYEITLTISDPTPWVQVADRSALSEKRVWRLRVRDKKRGGG